MSVQIITEIISFPQTDVKHVKKVGVAGEDMEQVVEVKVTVAQLPTTQAIDNMIQSGQVQTSVNGITIQNGLTTSLLSAKAATGNNTTQKNTCFHPGWGEKMRRGGIFPQLGLNFFMGLCCKLSI